MPLDFPSTLWGCNTPSKDSEVSKSVTGASLAPFPLRKFPSPTSVPRPPSSSFCLLLTFSSSLFTSPRPSPFSRRRWRPTFRSGADDCLSLVENRSHSGCPLYPSPGLLILHTLSPFSSFQVLIYNFNCRRQTTLSEEHCDIRTLTL